MLPPEMASNFLTSEDGRVYCQSEGPKLVYASLLDSGATFPSLCPGDFHDLGIDANNYAAQTIEILETANGTVQARTYEMFVSPLQQGTLESLVDEDDAVWPYHAKYLGGLCPVTTVVNAITEPDANGFIPNQRLSVCFPSLPAMSQAPQRGIVYSWARIAMTLWGATRLLDIEDGTLACLRYKRSTMTPGGCMVIPRSGSLIGMV
jgi:hypothetical protein